MIWRRIMSILRNFSDNRLKAWFHLDALFVTSVYSGLQYYPSLLFEIFLVILETPLCLLLLTKTLSPGGFSTTTHVDTDVSNFRRTVTLWKQIKRLSVTFVYQIIYVFQGLGLLPRYSFYIVFFLPYCFCFVCLVLFVLFVLFLCPYACFVIGVGAIKPAC